MSGAWGSSEGVTRCLGQMRGCLWCLDHARCEGTCIRVVHTYVLGVVWGAWTSCEEAWAVATRCGPDVRVVQAI